MTGISKLTQAVAGAALLVGAFSLPAAADDLVVRTPAPAAPARDAFRGPAAVITAPVAIAGTIVHWPFAATESVFPPAANDPRVFVGAPVHLAGQIAGLPFYAVNTTLFGVPSYY